MNASDRDGRRAAKHVGGVSVRDILDATGLTVSDLFITDTSTPTSSRQRQDTPGPNATRPGPVVSRVKAIIVGLGIAGWLSQQATDRLLRFLRLQSA